MKSFSYYEGRDIPRPKSREEYSKVFVYNNGAVLFSGTAHEFWLFEQEHGKFASSAVKQNVVDTAAYHAGKEAYRRALQDRRAEFKQDLFEEANHLDARDVPTSKLERVYAFSVEECGDEGLERVADMFSSIVDILKS